MLLVRELVPYWSSSREVLPASNGSRGSALGAQSRPSGSCRSRQQLPFLLLLLLLLYGRRSGGTTALARAPRALPARPLNLVLARLHLSPPANRSPRDRQGPHLTLKNLQQQVGWGTRLPGEENRRAEECGGFRKSSHHRLYEKTQNGLLLTF